jgi:hypothetical protein
MTLPSLLRRLQILLVALPFFALGCNGSSPTEPVGQPEAAVAAQVQAAPVTQGEEASGGPRPPAAAQLARAALARGRTDGAPAPGPVSATAESRGHGNSGTHGNGGNGNGNGGNGGNGGGNGGNGGGHRGDLTFEIHPDTWNTNWAHAEGNVQAFVRGTDAAKIDTSSVLLVAPSGDTLVPRSARVAGGQLVATFAKADAFDLLGDSVHSGDRVEVTLRFKVADTQTELTDTIRIVGPEPGDDGNGDDNGGDLALNIDPDDWNTNWAHSAGMVHAFIRGTGLADIDLTTVRLVGDKAGADPLEPLDVRRVGHQVVARFAKSAAFATLDDPDSGETHTVKITFKKAGADTELSEDVHIVGP